MFLKLQEWYDDWHKIHMKKYDADHVLVKLLEAELVYAQMWTVCVALRGVQWDKVSVVSGLTSVAEAPVAPARTARVGSAGQGRRMELSRHFPQISPFPGAPQV